MKRYVKASITSEVNDIIHSEKDVMAIPQQTTPCRSEEDVRFQVRFDNVENLEITKYELGDPDYWDSNNRRGLNPNYQEPYYVGRWTVYQNYNATRNEELNAILKRIKTYGELKELCDALENSGYGIWFYTKRKDNTVGFFYEIPNEPDYVEYLVERHDATLKCKISNLYKVLTIK